MITVEWRLEACPKCKYTRKVKYTSWDDRTFQRSTAFGLCSACDLVDRAERHERQASEFRKRAAGIRETRKAKA